MSPRRWSWRIVRRAGAVAALALLALELRLLPGFVAPPALLDSGEPVTDLARFPPATERASARLPSGEVLRGLYLAGEPGAPLILQLAESSGSAVSRSLPYDDLFHEAADAGCGALMLDYRGVGGSDGERSTSQLEEDALAMWSAALERVDGDASRIVVRGNSIGAIAAAALMDGTRAPAAWILIAPVRPETTVRHFVESQYGRALAWLVDPLFEPLVEFHLEERLPRAAATLVVVSPVDDFILPPVEQDLLRAAVRAAGGVWHDSPQGHEWTCLSAHELASKDEALLRSLFGDWPDAAARFGAAFSALPTPLAEQLAADPAWLARFRTMSARTVRIAPWLIAAAARHADDLERAHEALEDAWLDRSGRLRRMDFEVACAWFDARDPAGALDLRALRVLWVGLQTARTAEDVFGCPSTIAGVLELAADVERDALRGPCELHRFDLARGWTNTRLRCADLWKSLTQVQRLGLDDAHRHVVRLLLKSMLIADRVVADGERTRLEAFEDGAWMPVDLSRAAALVASSTAAGETSGL